MKLPLILLTLWSLASCSAPLYTVTRTVSTPATTLASDGFAPNDVTGRLLVIDRSKEEFVGSTLPEEIEKSFNDDWTQTKPNAEWRKIGQPGWKETIDFSDGSQWIIERTLHDPTYHAGDIPVQDKTSASYTKTGKNTATVTTSYNHTRTIDQGGPVTRELVFTSPNKGYIKPYVAYGGIAPYAVRNLTFSLDTATDPAQRLRTHINQAATLTLEPDTPDGTATKANRRSLPEQQAQTVKAILSRMKYRPASSGSFGTDSLWNLSLIDKKGKPLLTLPSTSLGTNGSLQFADRSDEHTFLDIMDKAYDRIKYTTEEAMHKHPFTVTGHLSYDGKTYTLDVQTVEIPQFDQTRQYGYPGQHLTTSSALPSSLQNELQRQPAHNNTRFLHLRFDGHYRKGNLIIDKIRHMAPAERQYLQSIGEQSPSSLPAQ